MENMKDFINNICKENNISLRQLAIKSGMTPQNLSNKIARNSFYVEDLNLIAKALNKDIQVIFLDKESGEPSH